VAGSRPSFRQAVFALGRNGLPAPEGGWTGFRPKRRGAIWAHEPLGPIQGMGARRLVLDGFRTWGSPTGRERSGSSSRPTGISSAAGFRESPVRSPVRRPPEGFALAGTVLFLEYRADRERSAYYCPWFDHGFRRSKRKRECGRNGLPPIFARLRSTEKGRCPESRGAALLSSRSATVFRSLKTTRLSCRISRPSWTGFLEDEPLPLGRASETGWAILRPSGTSPSRKGNQ